MSNKKRELQTQGKGNEPKTIPFDDALRRMVNTPPKLKKGGKGEAGSGGKPKRKRSERNGKKTR